ncbi:MAG TPA: sigma-70 family RNA polymerase sigma factor [Caldilineaceae bacterium]|nr:sigma-70 family RNA polymerase sigma factor [Caldilineaceae bacterium]
MTDLTQLVQAAQRGDRAAFGQIVVRFQDMAFAGAYAVLGDPHAAQDAAQEAFLEAYRNLSNLREPAAFPGWFRRIVLGRSHRELRKKPPSVIPLEEIAFYAGNPLERFADDPAAQVENWQLGADLARALDALPETQRLAVMLHHVEGYAYQEIADFLEVPLSTVKKRLFDARRKLQGRMLHMVQNQLQATKPSQDESFAQQVQFFLALRDEDLATLKSLVAQNPDLLKAQTEWKMALGLFYWPTGSTALHLAAAGMGGAEMLPYLLTQPVDLTARDRGGVTPLHITAIMEQPQNAQLLLDHGADPNMRAANDQTPLHHAALRNQLAIAEILLNAGADPTLQDGQGHTAMDWAVLRQNPAMVDLLVAHGMNMPADFTPPPAVDEPIPTNGDENPEHLLGAILNRDGTVRTPSTRSATQHGWARRQIVQTPASPILHTGLKFIDLMAPLARGGQNGIFTPLSGVGFVVTIGQMIYSMGARRERRRRGYTVWLMQESAMHRAEEQKLNWREAGVENEIIYVTSATKADMAAQQETVTTGLRIANQLQRNGHDVLLLIDAQLAEVEGVLPYLRSNAAVGPEAAVTTLINGHHTVGALPTCYAGLDAVLTFDYNRAIYRLYPALDLVRSRSTLLERGLVSPVQQEVAAEVRRLLQRYDDLRPPMEQYKLTVDDLWYIEDDPNLATDINRARRLDRFFTQSFHGGEPYSGIAGQLIPLAETIASCQAILAGAVDEVPEEAFLYIGAIAEVKR